MENTYTSKKLTKLQLSITLILILFCSVTGATYAYFASVQSDSSTIRGNMATVTLKLDVEKIFPLNSRENTGVIVPQLSTSGSSNSALSSALKKGCVDDNANIVCQVYKVAIKNNGGTATLMVDGEILFYGDNELTTDVNTTMPNLRWKLIKSADKDNPSNSILGNNIDLIADANDDNVFADDITLETNDNNDYYLIIWLNETNSDQIADEGSTFYASIKVNASNGIGVTATFSNYAYPNE